MKICIDAGHGAGNTKTGVYDPGAQGGGMSEADIALAWALTGKWVCQKHGIQVFLTRDDDRDPCPVWQRDNEAQAALCTHFVSIHCNAGGGTGCEAFYRDAVDARLARKGLDVLLKLTKGKSRGIKMEGASQHSRLAIFDFRGPAALFEIGFIDSAQDRKWMTSREVRLGFWEGLVAELLKP